MLNILWSCAVFVLPSAPPEMLLENMFLDTIDLLNLLTFVKIYGTVVKMDLLDWMTSLNQRSSSVNMDPSSVVNVTIAAPTTEM